MRPSTRPSTRPSMKPPLMSSRSGCMEEARPKERVVQRWNLLQMALKNSTWIAYHPSEASSISRTLRKEGPLSRRRNRGDSEVEGDRLAFIGSSLASCCCSCYCLVFHITALYSKTLGFILIGSDRTCDILAVLVVLPY